jgi:hypothetical protein
MKTNTLHLVILALLNYFTTTLGLEAVVPPPDGGYPGFTTAEGTKALFSLTNGSANTAVGWYSLFSNAEGSFNTATGAGALLFNTANENTAFGAASLLFNTSGNRNTAVGAAALLNNTEGGGNTAVGGGALHNNSTGDTNTAIGHFALFSNITGLGNTATGDSALFNNEGDNNTANGSFALGGNTTGTGNTASGWGALFSNTTGGANTAVGNSALFDTTTGDGNTATGEGALANNTTGSFNIAVGSGAGSLLTTGDFNICIGNLGVNGDSRVIRIGIEGEQTITFIAGIDGAPVTGQAVHVSNNGQLGIQASSQRFKDEIKAMDTASEAILALKPVAFRYKREIDPAAVPQFGLLAEDVEAVNPDLVVRDKEGKPYSVRYDQVNAMLLNEFLKEHRTVQELKSNSAKQEATIAEQQKQIDALTAGLQKVSAQLELNKPAAQTVLNDQ